MSRTGTCAYSPLPAQNCCARSWAASARLMCGCLAPTSGRCSEATTGMLWEQSVVADMSACCMNHHATQCTAARPVIVPRLLNGRVSHRHKHSQQAAARAGGDAAAGGRPRGAGAHGLVARGADLLQEARGVLARRAGKAQAREEGQRVGPRAVEEHDALADQHDVVEQRESLRRRLLQRRQHGRLRAPRGRGLLSCSPATGRACKAPDCARASGASCCRRGRHYCCPAGCPVRQIDCHDNTLKKALAPCRPARACNHITVPGWRLACEHACPHAWRHMRPKGCQAVHV